MRVDRRREEGALDGHLTVALDEHDQHVFAAQAGEQVLAGCDGERVGRLEVGGERVLVVDVCTDQVRLAVSQPGGCRRRDTCSADGLDAERRAQRPHDGERADSTGRRSAMPRGERRHVDGRHRHEDE